jgi:hypothetical protein
VWVRQWKEKEGLLLNKKTKRSLEIWQGKIDIEE